MSDTWVEFGIGWAKIHYCREITDADRAALSGALNGAPSPATWQSIETAPKDGTQVLVSDQNNMWMTCARFWPANSFWIEDVASGLKLNPPTHWMPLPEGPSDPVSRSGDGK